MSFFSNFFSLSRPIADNVSTLGDDVLNAKTALKGLGHFKGNVNQWPDKPMLDSLKKFQQSVGLDVDGVMKPGGPVYRRWWKG